MVRVRDGPASRACSPSATRSRTAAASCSGASRCSRGRSGPRAGSGLPYTGCAVDGATAHDVVAVQIPASSPRVRRPGGALRRRLPLRRRQRRARPRWDAAAYERDLRAAARLPARSAATRVLVVHDPARPRPAARGRGADRGGRTRRSSAAASGALVCDLRDFGARNRVMVDAVHPTAFGQVAIAERALDVLAADGMPVRVRPSHADPLGDDALEAAARRRDLRVPPGQAGGAERVLARPGAPRGLARRAGPSAWIGGSRPR